MINPPDAQPVSKGYARGFPAEMIQINVVILGWPLAHLTHVASAMMRRFSTCGLPLRFVVMS
jgi:hypothetical protein